MGWGGDSGDGGGRGSGGRRGSGGGSGGDVNSGGGDVSGRDDYEDEDDNDEDEREGDDGDGEDGNEDDDEDKGCGRMEPHPPQRDGKCKSECHENKCQARKPRKRKRRKNRRRRKGKTTGDVQKDVEIVLAHWNARSLRPKEEILKEELKKEGVGMCMVCETHMYKSDDLSDRSWVWKAGQENRPEPGYAPSRGIGALTSRLIKSSTVHVSKDIMAERVEMAGGCPIFVLEAHFPQSSDIKGHSQMWDRIEELYCRYIVQGDVVLMGDMNAHTKANGDHREDRAGKMLKTRTKRMRMTILNHTSVCEGEYTWEMEGADGTQNRSTIDYVMVSPSLEGRVKSMRLGERMGSDHKMVVVRIAGESQRNPSAELREVWKVEDIPERGEDRKGFIGAFQDAFRAWGETAATRIQAMEAVGVEAQRVMDIMEWSFQVTLDEVCQAKLGSKRVGPKSVPKLDGAMRMLDDHRKICEQMLRVTMSDSNSSHEERVKAVALYRQAKRELFDATRRRKQLVELECFRQIEEKQSDSKLFWSRAKRITGRMRPSISPPPMVEVEDGKVESDPVEVLRAWRRFSAEIASQTQEEEGIYDDDHRKEVEERLGELRRVLVSQRMLDDQITEEEVFAAIRKLKMGKAPGIDGILTSIIKTAADAVYTNKLKRGNTVVGALTLLFNYVFEQERWPKRWGSGIIFPLFKQDNRLEPGNYRPITLLSVVGKLFGSVIEKRLSDWSERTGAIVDEQGGFRRGRGTPDQIYLLREIISSRTERGLPTLVTYIDVRKAYDTVWREGSYVRLHESGIRGKVWRQLQAMGDGLRSRIRLPFGETEWFEVRRGVAQGAAESPWLYSNFINGLAVELKERGLGVVIGGRRVPLLMYADDIVMMASTVYELQQMNAIATRYAYRNRFRFNGEKSAVMLFNANAELTARARNTEWTLFGEKVKVKKEYRYLGVDVRTNTADWRTHMGRTLQKARDRSNDLLWMCRGDAGLRPRSAVTLWKAIVRPVLEYAAELWAGEISRELVRQAEQIQTEFARGVLGLTKKFGIGNDVIRAELGLEKLEARWQKLRLGYWRRIQNADRRRLLRTVSEVRRGQVLANAGQRSWMWGSRRLLQEMQLSRYWYDPDEVVRHSKLAWKRIVYRQVEQEQEHERRRRMEGSLSMETYLKVKNWNRMDSQRAQFEGEIGKLGALVCERYLDGVEEKTGCKLKLMCRVGCLPVLQRVAWENKWDPGWARCMMCDSGRAEDIQHFMLECKAYKRHREWMMSRVAAHAPVETDERMAALLGARMASRKVEDKIDHAVQRFLKKAWRVRKTLTKAINRELGRRDLVGEITNFHF